MSSSKNLLACVCVDSESEYFGSAADGVAPSLNLFLSYSHPSEFILQFDLLATNYL